MADHGSWPQSGDAVLGRPNGRVGDPISPAAATFRQRPGAGYPAWVGLIFDVRAESGDRVHSFGARRTRGEAELLLAAAREQVAAAGGRNDRYWIEQIDTIGMFEITSRPTPRERFTTRVTPTSAEGAWRTVRVEILVAGRVVAIFDRNYSMLHGLPMFPCRSRPHDDRFGDCRVRAAGATLLLVALDP